MWGGEGITHPPVCPLVGQLAPAGWPAGEGKSPGARGFGGTDIHIDQTRGGSGLHFPPVHWEAGTLPGGLLRGAAEGGQGIARKAAPSTTLPGISREPGSSQNPRACFFPQRSTLCF